MCPAWRARARVYEGSVSFGFPACSDGIRLTAVAVCPPPPLLPSLSVSRLANKFLQNKIMIAAWKTRGPAWRVTGRSTSAGHVPKVYFYPVLAVHGVDMS